jgi:hypothetical protein
MVQVMVLDAAGHNRYAAGCKIDVAGYNRDVAGCKETRQATSLQGNPATRNRITNES